jgi:hypothetical protein
MLCVVPPRPFVPLDGVRRFQLVAHLALRGERREECRVVLLDHPIKKRCFHARSLGGILATPLVAFPGQSARWRTAA